MEDKWKHRFWNEEEQEYFYQEDQYLSSFLRRIYDMYGVTHPSYLDFQIEDRLERCIGWRDVKNNLCYEKDKVLLKKSHWKSGGKIGIICKKDDCIDWYIRFDDSNMYKNKSIYKKLTMAIKDYNIEIIGNIHNTHTNKEKGKQ